MDAGLQDSPDEIPGTLSYDHGGGLRFSLVISKTLRSAFQKPTYQTLMRRRARLVGSRIASTLLVIAYRLEVVKNIEAYGEMHQLSLYLAKNAD